jgi:CBS domain-containing protein
VPSEYAADYLDRIRVGDACAKNVVTLRDDQIVDEVRDITATHQGFPVTDANGRLIGVVTRRDFMKAHDDTPLRALIRRPPAVVFPDSSLRDAADHMVRENVGRLPVVDRDDPGRIVGFITRSDLLKVHAKRLDEDR